jgi:hypothetical protein
VQNPGQLTLFPTGAAIGRSLLPVILDSLEPLFGVELHAVRIGQNQALF